MQERKRDNTSFNNFIKVCLVVALFIALLWTIPNWRCCGTGGSLGYVAPIQQSHQHYNGGGDCHSEKPCGSEVSPNTPKLEGDEIFTIDDLDITPHLFNTPNKSNKGYWINPVMIIPDSYNIPHQSVVGVDSPKTLWLILPLFISILALSFYRGRNN